MGILQVRFTPMVRIFEEDSYFKIYIDDNPDIFSGLLLKEM